MPSEQAKPMSDERLAELRARYGKGGVSSHFVVLDDMVSLLARLDAAEAKVKQINEAFAASDTEKYDELKWDAFTNAYPRSPAP